VKGLVAWFTAALVATAGGGCGVLVGLTGEYQDVSRGAAGADGTGGAGSGGASSIGGAGGGGGHGAAGRDGGGAGTGGGALCPPNADCEPGETRPCGNCGTETCQLPLCNFGPCENQGVCTPGAKQDCPGGCAQRICVDSCRWCGSCGACVDCTPSATNPWLGCGSTGCAICPAEVAGYPCYFENHPGCLPEVSCVAPTACSDLCPPPAAADACSCIAPPQGWHGCDSTGCEVCKSHVAGYACYFYNHPQCTASDGCQIGSAKCSNHCPEPTSADLPGM
jgi:hypothetical protein